MNNKVLLCLYYAYRPKPKNITQNGEHKEEALDDLLQKGREIVIVNETNTSTFSKPTPREIPEKRGGAHMRFSERTDAILN